MTYVLAAGPIPPTPPTFVPLLVSSFFPALTPLPARTACPAANEPQSPPLPVFHAAFSSSLLHTSRSRYLTAVLDVVTTTRASFASALRTAT